MRGSPPDFERTFPCTVIFCACAMIAIINSNVALRIVLFIFIYFYKNFYRKNRLQKPPAVIKNVVQVIKI